MRAVNVSTRRLLVTGSIRSAPTWDVNGPRSAHSGGLGDGRTWCCRVWERDAATMQSTVAGFNQSVPRACEIGRLA